MALMPSTLKSTLNSITKTNTNLADYLPTTSSTPVFAWLGTIPLPRNCYPSSLSETHSFSYATHERLNGKPILQATGSALTTQKWSTSLISTMCNVDEEIEKLKSVAAEQKALTLTYANGESPGQFVITNLSVAYKQVSEGKTLQADINFDLLEYVETHPGIQSTIQQKTNALGNLAKELISTKQLPKITTPKAQEVAKNIGNTLAMRASNAITRM